MNLIPRKYYLDDFFDDLATESKQTLKCDIYEKDNTYHIEMDVPGFKKEDIDIDCHDGYLTITVAKSEAKDDEEKNYIRKERYTSEYKRQFYLGNLDAENIKAEFKEGVLNITVPKKEEDSSNRKIEIE